MRADPCVPGPVRVVIDRADKLPLSVQTYVGPADSTLRGVTDLGHVRAQDAADYLLSLAAKVDGRAGRDALMPAMLADSANTARALVAIAKNTALPRETRRSALSYMGRSTDGMQTIPASVTEPILAIARDETDNQSVRQQALSRARPPRPRRRHSAAHSALAADAEHVAGEGIDVRRSRAPAIRAPASTCAPRCKRTDLPDDVLTVALRSLGQEYATAQDAALLREVYPTLKSDRVARSGVLGAGRDGRLGEHEVAARRWRRTATSRSRRVAARVDAASRAGAPIADLIQLYDTTTDPSMKQSLIGIYIRNGEQGGGRQAAHDREGRGEHLRPPERDLAAVAVGRSADQGGASGHRDEDRWVNRWTGGPVPVDR